MSTPKPTTYDDALKKCMDAISNAENATELYIFVGLSNISSELNISLSPKGWRAFYDGEGYYSLEQI